MTQTAHEALELVEKLARSTDLNDAANRLAAIQAEARRIIEARTERYLMSNAHHCPFPPGVGKSDGGANV